MHRKSSNPVLKLKNTSVSPVVECYFEISRLKQLFRQGWLQREIPDDLCESVAEHTFGVLMLAMLVADHFEFNLNLEKVFRLSLIHDLGEIDAGDITPEHRVASRDKSNLERESVKRVLRRMPNRKVYLKLWDEYEQGLSPEANFVKQVEKLEMALQASVYEALEDKDLSEFNQSASELINLPELENILEELALIRE